MAIPYEFGTANVLGRKCTFFNGIYNKTRFKRGKEERAERPVKVRMRHWLALHR